MQLPTPQVYALQLDGHATYKVVLSGAARKGFARPATVRCPKLYVVTRQQEIHYVGVTNSPLSARINQGLKAKGKGGYHGYKWKNIQDPLGLFVWSFLGKGPPSKQELETVEAEFAFLVRKETDCWPMSQTEIHFHQATPAHLDAALAMHRAVMDHLGSPSRSPASCTIRQCLSS